MKPSYIRIYFSDWQVLALLKIKGYGYTKEIACELKKTRRTIAYTFKKLENLGLVERCGNPRCPFQWFQLNPSSKELIIDFVRNLGVLFSLRKFKKNCFFIFDNLLFHARVKQRNDPSRPLGFSVRFSEMRFFRKLYKRLKKFFPHIRPLKPPDVLIERVGKKTYHISVVKTLAGKRDVFHYWINRDTVF